MNNVIFSMVRLFLLSLTYFVSGWLGLKLPFVGTHITLVWLPTGIAVAALNRWGKSVWSGIYVGAFLVNLFTGASWLLAATIAIGNTLAPILSVNLLNRFGFHSDFDRQKDVGLLVLAAALGMILSALGGAFSLYLAGEIAINDLSFAMLSWWLGDTIGVLLAAPLLITLSWDNLRHLSRARKELLLWVLVAITIAWLTLVQDYEYQQQGHTLPLAFLTIPLLTWSGLRFGNTGAALAGLGFSLIAAWGTAAGKGVFVLSDIRLSLFLLWAYMATTVLTGFIITALQAERLKVEKELQITTASLKDAQQIANIGSWRFDLLSGKLNWSDEVFRLFEISPCQKSITHETFLNIVHPEDRDRVNHIVKRIYNDHVPYEITYRLLMPDDRVKWIFERCKTDYDTNGIPIYYQGTIQDITEHKYAAESLRILSQAVKQSPSSIVITDLDANIEFANDAFYKATGYSSSETVGQNPKILKSGKTPPATYINLWENLTNGHSWKGEFTNKRKDGSEYIESALISPVYQTDRRITHYLAIKDDITEKKQAEIALKDANQQMQSLLNSMAEGAYMVDTDGNCKFVNQSFLRILGYKCADEIIGKHIHELIHHSYPDGTIYPSSECQMYIAFRRNEEVHVINEVFWRKDGVAVPVEYHSQPIMTNGIVTGAIATFLDISERKHFEDTLREHEERLSLASFHNGVGIWDWNLLTQELIWDDSMYALYRIRREDFAGTEEAWRQSLHPDDLEREDQEIEAALAGEKPFNTEFRVCCPNGEIRHIKAVAKVFHDDQGKPLRMLGTNIDITDRKYLQFELEKRAYTDYLTEVSNRRHFMEQAELELNRSIRYGNDLSIFMMDVDFFKKINDNYGHKTGDVVLKKLTEVCRETLREIDQIGRIGGEEFAVLLPETGLAKAAEAAERLREVIANTKIPLENGLPLHFTVSIGVASLSSKEDNVDVLLNLADQALYEAKETGRNKVCLTPF